MTSIIEEFHALLNNYLDKKILEDDVRYWIGCHLGEPPDEIVPLFYDVVLAMWDMDAGHGTEDDFRSAITELLLEEPEPASVKYPQRGATLVIEFRSLLNDYLGGKTHRNEVRRWLKCNLGVGQPADELVPLVYGVSLAMSDMDKGRATEDDFRAAITRLLTIRPVLQGDA